MRARRANDHYVLLASAWSSAASAPEARARSLGAYLTEWGDAPREALEEQLRTLSWRSASAQIERLDRVGSEPGLPAGYREDAARVAGALREALLDDPLDASDSSWPAFQRFLASYGRLLAAWGEILAAARRIAPHAESL